MAILMPIDPLGIEKEASGLLYHKIISSNNPDFNSENIVIKAVINQTEHAQIGFEGTKTLWRLKRSKYMNTVLRTCLN
jgi:hypothetical protein